MPAPAPVPSAVQIAVAGHIVDSAGYNRPTVNLFTYASVSAPSTYVPVLATLLSSFAANVAASWKVCFSSDWICDNVIARDLVHPTIPPAFWATPTDFSGTAGPPSGSTQESAYVEWTTAARGKSFRGGTRISPIPDAMVVENHLDPAQRTLYITLTNGLKVTNNDGVWAYDLYIWSRKYSSLDPVLDNVITATKVLAAKVRKSTGTMKRRKSRGVY